jgi:hypothetical protein
MTWLIDFHLGQKDLIDSYHSARWSLCVVTWCDVTDRFPYWAERSDRFLPFSRMIIVCRDMMWCDWSISTLGRKIWSISTFWQDDHCVFWHDVTRLIDFQPRQKDLINPYYSAGRSLCVVTLRDWSISTLGRKIWSIPTIQQDDHCVSWHDVTWLIDLHPGQKELIDSYHSAGWSLCVVTWCDVTDRFPLWAERSDRFLPFSRMIIVCFDMTWRDWSIFNLCRKIWTTPTIQQEDHCVSWRDVTDRFLLCSERSDRFLSFSRKIITCRDMTWCDW